MKANISFGDKLQWLRKQQKLSLRALHRESGVSLSHLSQMENNNRLPSPYILKKIAPFLNVSIAELLQDAGHFEEDDVEYNEDVIMEPSYDPNELTHFIKLPFTTVDGITLENDESDRIITFARAVIFERGLTQDRDFFNQIMKEVKARLEKQEE